jgi:DNA polymerase elongation subunit (family B)
MEEKKIGTLIKAYASRRKMTESIDYDAVLLIYRDEKGQKQTKFIDRAEVPFYVIKDKESAEAIFPPMFIEKDKVEKLATYSDMVFKEIAAQTDSLYYYDRVLTTWGPRSFNMKNLFKHNYIYDADMDIADRYIAKFHEEFEPNVNYKIHKCYFDIEVDLMPDGFKKDSRGNIGFMGFPDEELAPVPVNIITLLDEKTMTVHTFVVRNPKSESLKNFESKVQDFSKKISDKIRNEDGMLLNGVNINHYNDELEAIEAFFKKVHDIDPDFVLAWNLSFDMQTLQNRLVKLYIDLQPKGEKNRRNAYDKMVTTISDNKYTIQTDRHGKTLYLPPKAYYVAQKDKSFVDRTDYFDVTDGINWFDQMLYYATIRKTGGQKESYSLDAIAMEELDKEKLPLSPGETLKTLPWNNFEKFAEYNIRDVLLLQLLEEKNLDMDMLQRLSEVTNTRKEKVFKKTISLKNFVNKYAQDMGFVMTNNKNAKYGEDTEYFEQNFLATNKISEHEREYLDLFNRKENWGAYVADPNQNMPDNGILLNGRPSKFLFENVFDEDFSSLYPSIIRAYNLDKNTQIGKFFLIDKHIKERLETNYGYDDLFTQSKNIEAEENNGESTNDLGPTLVDSLMSFNFVRIGEKFFDLPSTEELIKKIKEKKEI